MQVTVKFLGALGDQVGMPRLPVEIPADGTYRDVLDVVGSTMRTRLPEWTWDAERRSFSRRLMVSLNGTADLRDETVRLTEGDEILVVLPLAGG